jgi:putative N6-adenine-specific DNA methylase
MVDEGPLSKRIKRHVIGRSRQFWVVTTPGLETLCRDEIRNLPDPPQRIDVAHGGVTFWGRLTTCYQANLYLRTASRILMRLARCEATRFDQLEAFAARFPWELYLPLSSSPNIQVTTKRSKLYHSDAVIQRLRKTIDARLAPYRNAQTAASEAANHQAAIIQLRINRNRCRFSIDSSGELLYRRGLKRSVGTAPIRETTAAALLQWTGYDGHSPLLDPMCGSGTFAIEAACRAQAIPAGWYRHFAFEQWPCFRQTHWAYIRNQADRHMHNKDTGVKPIIRASDIDADQCRRLKQNLQAYPWAKSIAVVQQDFFAVQPSKLNLEPGVVLLNPPYGERLGTKVALETLLTRMGRHLHEHYRLWQLGLIIPHTRWRHLLPFEVHARQVVLGGKMRLILTGTVH